MTSETQGTAARGTAAKPKAKRSVPMVPVRPELPDPCGHYQLVRAINDLQAWLVAVKTVTQQKCLTIMRVQGTCSIAQDILSDLGLPPLVNGSTRTKAVIPVPEPLIASHYTEEGLRFRWVKLNEEVDTWIANARRVAAREAGLSRTTTDTVSKWLAAIRQEPLRKVYQAEVNAGLWQWPVGRNEDLKALAQEIADAITAFAVSKGVDAADVKQMNSKVFASRKEFIA